MQEINAIYFALSPFGADILYLVFLICENLC